MKKQILLMIVLIAAIGANAQKFSLGPVAGIGNGWTNSKTWVFPQLEKKNNQTSLCGIQLLLKAEKHFYISGNVLYSDEGFTLGEEKKPYYTNFEMEYIRVNIQPVYYPLKSGVFIQPKISAGFSGGYLIDGVSQFTDNSANELGFKTKDIVKSKFDFGYRIEAGIDFRLNRSIRLTTSAAYYNGNSRIPENGRRLENKNISYNAGFLFRTSKS